jgi:hypothetical protein
LAPTARISAMSLRTFSTFSKLVGVSTGTAANPPTTIPTKNDCYKVVWGPRAIQANSDCLFGFHTRGVIVFFVAVFCS